MLYCNNVVVYKVVYKVLT